MVSFSTSKKRPITRQNINPNAKEKLKPGEKLQGSYIRKRPERVSETTLRKRYEDYRLATNADKNLFRKSENYHRNSVKKTTNKKSNTLPLFQIGIRCFIETSCNLAKQVHFKLISHQ